MPVATPGPSSRHLRTLSPPLSSAASSSQAFTVGLGNQNQQKLNVVTRLAIQGRAKPGQDGAAIRVYLKISLPLDSIAPNSTIPLFPEENVKILSAQIHPIDPSTSAPYNFSSSTSPLLHKAARALNLPARSSQSYLSLFGLAPPQAHQSTSSSSHTRRSSSNGSQAQDIPPLDERYTGQILVSQYNVSYVLPKEFPPFPTPKMRTSGLDYDDGRSSRASSGRSRRASIGGGDKNLLQFMAAIEMWVPFLSRPPRAPYLLSIPTPRCLSNHIKLRIFPPNSPSLSTTTASLHSLSSAEGDEYAGSWELTSDPHVTRSTSRSSHSHSHYGINSNSASGGSGLTKGKYVADADDETSDSNNSVSMGFVDGCGIGGTFPSAERIRIRWAVPVRGSSGRGEESGRRRVGVREVKGEMVCIVLGRAQPSPLLPMRGGRKGEGEGVLMRLEYTATCKGIFFPGVATLLGMDLSLDAQGSHVTWVSSPQFKAGWSVGGGAGFTGWDVGSPPSSGQGLVNGVGRVEETPGVYVSPASPPGVNGRPSSRMGVGEQLQQQLHPPSRHSSSSSTASLLRAPLPAAQHLAEYSFEGSPTSTTPLTGTMVSSMESLPPGSGLLNGDGREEEGEGEGEGGRVRPPVVPITLHVNMNDFLSPNKNVFTFRIEGFVCVRPRPSPFSYASSKESPSTSDDGDGEGEGEVVALPRFRVLAADQETLSMVVRSDVQGAGVDGSGSAGGEVEVFSSVGDVRDLERRKGVLKKGGMIRCGSEGGRIILRQVRPPPPPHRPEVNGRLTTPIRPRTPVGGDGGGGTMHSNLSRSSSSGSLRQMYATAPGAVSFRPRRDGRLMIPYVKATVTPLVIVPEPDELGNGEEGDGMGLPNAYAVRVCLPCPAEADSEWLEFGLAQPAASSSSSGEEVVDSRPPRVEVASASVEGVPVRYETSVGTKADGSGSGLGGVGFEEMSGKEWLSWVRVHVGSGGGGLVRVDYVVKNRGWDSRNGDERSVPTKRGKGKAKAADSVPFSVFLPTFQLPVGRLEVNVETSLGFNISTLRSNLSHQQQSSPAGDRKLLHYSLEELFYPRLFLT
ncbi:hypothetical protein JAAARDRAFT_67494 [Jaapia argillacea MUCL 33604]|uniref:Uncharacterized protein n=1 Tax=Jaapia argillacea MUCL 33604 TaxID=933084 RepID=A0A067QC76_9AGAM|nr:hypothetical protein JAAARDRAFT_67494 [Jaapia argillacea MUCL 33604]